MEHVTLCKQGYSFWSCYKDKGGQELMSAVKQHEGASFMNIYPLMCEALISLPTSEETSGEVTILLVTSPEVSN